MATVQTIARDLLASVSTDAGFLNAVNWVNHRYAQLVSQVRFDHLRKLGELAIPNAVTTGTVAVTAGSATVTGTGTAWATDPGTSINAYWYIKLGSEWYNVSSIDSATQLTLATAYTQDTDSTMTYTLVKRYHEVDSSARWLGTFIHTRLRTKLDGPVSMDKLDRDSPGRTFAEGIPLRVATAGTDSTGVLLVEVYPYCKDDELLHYTYWDLPTELAVTDSIPPQIDAHVIKEGALVDLYRYLKSKALQAGQIEMAMVYRNDEHAQRTVWNRLIQDAARTSRGVDDTTLILEHFGGQLTARDIRTAHDQVMYNWQWP